MTTRLAGSDIAQESRAKSARCSMSWALIGSVGFNAALVAVLWGVYLATARHSMVNDLCGMATTMLILSCHALAALLTFAGKPASTGRVLLGIGLMAAAAVALAASPFCRHPWIGTIWGLVAVFIASPLAAAGLMRLFGLRLCSSSSRQEPSPLQFSIRSLFVATAIAAGYAFLTSSIMEDGVVMRVLRDMPPRRGVDGGNVVLNLVLCHVTVVTMSLVLWRARLRVHISLLGLLLLLPPLCDFRLGLPMEGLYIMALLGTCLLGLVWTSIPLMLAGVHVTWEKPVFER